MMETNIGEAFASGYNEAGMQIMKSTAAMQPGFVDLKKVAGLVRYLSSEDAGVINGTTVVADNGWIAYRAGR
jgi:NAD(P)-dependent dehydrogenase (short-subunit alcohol dehydrogenase family)